MTSDSTTPGLLRERLLPDIRRLLGDRLIGLYLSGSLVTGGFSEGVSDLDLIAVTVEDVDPATLVRLRAMHDQIARDDPAWDNRIEVIYIARRALETFRGEISRIAVISPGEPLHFVNAGRDWLMNWYLLRAHGRTLHGPAPEAIVAPVTMAEFVASLRAHAAAWSEWLPTQRSAPEQAYAILTLCRALCTIHHGAHVSKQEAAAWAQRAMPDWSPLIARALRWRAGVDLPADPETTFPETVRFVRAVQAEIAAR